MATRKKTGGGAKTGRTETLTVRLDPQLRYLSEIAGRVQRRTLSSFAEWAIEDSLHRIYVDPSDSTSVADMAAKLWDVYEPDRFAKLAFNAPHLLNYDEQRIWKVVQEYGLLWKGRWMPVGDGKRERFVWDVLERNIAFPKLRMYWDAICSVAAGDATLDALPQWEDEREVEDGIPF